MFSVINITREYSTAARWHMLVEAKSLGRHSRDTMYLWMTFPGELNLTRKKDP